MSSKKNNEITQSAATNNKRFNSTSIKLLLGLAVGVALLVACTQVPEEFWRQLLSTRFLEANVMGFIMLSAMYLLAVLLMAPLSPFALTAGLLFGFWWGTFLALLALNLGAALAFFDCTPSSSRAGRRTVGWQRANGNPGPRDAR